ncbi:MAG TPA: hypothetical protein PKL13_00500 [bacterium]|nr:hypothetical protein [bacterium]
MSFEDSINRLFQEADRVKRSNETFRNPEYLEECYKIALENLSIDTIDISDPVFLTKYSQAEINEDKKHVQALEHNFDESNTDIAKNNKKIGTILEAFLYNQIEQNLILGMNVHTISTCKYDDYHNRVDTIMELLPEESDEYEHLALAYDATLTSNTDQLNKKVESLKRDILNGRLANIKYFKSENSYQLSLENIPKLVIGMDMFNLENVIRLWMGVINQEKGSNDKLINHPFRLIIIDQIILQLEYFVEYAKSINQDSIAKEYENILIFFKQLNDEKDMKSLRDGILSDPKKLQMYENDNVLNFFKDLRYKK